MNDENTPAFNEGFEAYFQDVEQDDNPYLTADCNDERAMDWDLGWYEAWVSDQ